MGHKNSFHSTFQWQSTSPTIGFLPTHPDGGSTTLTGSAGVAAQSGSMSGTNTIYSNILVVGRMDNQGLEVNYIGNATGTLTVNVSNSGINFYPLTFTPNLTQPSGSSGGYVINLNQLPFRFMFLQYTNVTGSGTLTVYSNCKDLN